VQLPVSCNLLLTISEEVGSGASAVLHGDVAEMVAVDNSTCGPGQESSEFGVTAVVMDMSGPFDYHLTHKLIGLCQEFGIEHARDVFKQYRTDAASAIEAGNDIRTALICFGVDASHGFERSHIDSLRAVAELMALYLQSPLTFTRDRQDLGSLKGFPTLPA
jgi:putative aminopeptidase FrvX